MIKLIDRSQSVITGKRNLEPLYTFKDFPVFFGCVDTDTKEDIRSDMRWTIDPETGVIQLDKLIPSEILYQAQHVDGTGQTWNQYYNDLSNFIKHEGGANILEIGGGQGRLADLFISTTDHTSWTMVEPNPLHKETQRIKIKKAFFDEKFVYDGKVDTVVFSQVLEHANDPRLFIQSIAKFLPDGGHLIFAYPNLKLLLEHKYTNAINFEHSMFLTDYFVDHLLAEEGFTIVNKFAYKNHSHFYNVIKKTSPMAPVENKYHEYKKIFMDFIDYNRNLVSDINEKTNTLEGPVYVFGAHIFSQYLFNFGLNQNKICGILDNSALKQGKRLYGTPFRVFSPETIKDKKMPVVILKVGLYRDEIYKQLLQINPTVRVIE